MIKLDFYKDKNFALFGLGISGIAAAKALLAGGANVICWDDSEQARLKAAEESIPLCHLQEIEWSQLHGLVLAPGVPILHPAPHWSVKLAQQHKVQILGDIELFVQQRNYFLQKNSLNTIDMPFIAITGTNGKSTTTNLIKHLLRSIGKKCEMGGNIGRPVLDLAPMAKDIFYVVECSSFQIELSPDINPDIGILLNITPDHLDRHGTMINYKNIKQRLVRGARIALLPYDMEVEVAESSPMTRVVTAVDKKISEGYYSDDGKLYHNSHFLVNLQSNLALLGPHNAQNALNAIAAVQEVLGEKAVDINWQEICDNYQSLPHRMQYVRTIGKVRFINDSKATNAEATMQALESFDNIYWIIGGIAKKGGIESLKHLFSKIKKAYLIGEASQDFAKTIKNDMEYEYSGTLEKAIKHAFNEASSENSASVILLSPACASYDQFANYSARGEAFVKIVHEL